MTGAIVFYLVVKRENLLPMITGHKQWHQTVDSAGGSPAKAFFLAAILAIAVYFVVS